jgi:hypothetical protein
VRVHKGAARGEPQSAAGFHTGGEEGSKQPGEVPGRNTYARITHAENNGVRFPGHINLNAAILMKSLNRIPKQVDHYLEQLRFASPYQASRIQTIVE